MNVYGTEGPIISEQDYQIYLRLVGLDDPVWEEGLRLNRLANDFFSDHMLPPPPESNTSTAQWWRRAHAS
jgi:hypothetical protein